MRKEAKLARQMACQIRNRKPFQKQNKEHGELGERNVHRGSTAFPLDVKIKHCYSSAFNNSSSSFICWSCIFNRIRLHRGVSLNREVCRVLIRTPPPKKARFCPFDICRCRRCFLSSSFGFRMRRNHHRRNNNRRGKTCCCVGTCSLQHLAPLLHLLTHQPRGRRRSGKLEASPSSQTKKKSQIFFPSQLPSDPLFKCLPPPPFWGPLAFPSSSLSSFFDILFLHGPFHRIFFCLFPFISYPVCSFFKSIIKKKKSASQ